MADLILDQADISEHFTDEELWGFIGVRLPGAQASKLYPIGQSQAARALQQIGEGAAWITLATLNNRALMIRMDACPRLSITDNDEAEPAEFYGAMVREWDAGLSEADYAGLYAYLAHGSRLAGPADSTARVLDLVREHALDDDALFRLLRVSRVHYRDGVADELPLDAEGSWAAFHAVQHDSERLLNLACRQRGLDVFVAPGQVAMIDMPLHPMREAAQEQAARYASEAEAKAALRAAKAKAAAAVKDEHRRR